VKVVQELLRHGSATVMMGAYSQAQMTAEQETLRMIPAKNWFVFATQAHSAPAFFEDYGGFESRR
jgi:hypothetical protein